MATKSKTPSPETDQAGAQAAEAAKPAINVLAQYTKDLSFESPKAPDSLREPGTNPNLQLQVNCGSRQVEDEVFEVQLQMEAKAQSDEGIIYNVELVYAGLFKVVNIPEGALEQVLMIECPRLLFPFARSVLADVTLQGGFPPLMLHPIDFIALYQEHAAKKAAEAEA